MSELNPRILGRASLSTVWNDVDGKRWAGSSRSEMISTTLQAVKALPFQDRVELTEWLLKPEEEQPIRPRTDSERLAYASGMASAIIMVDDEGMKKARKELQQIVESEEYIASRKAQRG